MKRLFVKLLVLFSIVQNGFCWSKAGHEAVAIIAYHKLNPKAKITVDALLQPETMKSMATWADLIKFKRPETRPWHFIDMDINKSWDINSMISLGTNTVTYQTGRQLDIIRNIKNSTAQRAEALKFVIHLVGDMSQPLHCATDDGDRGGNGKSISINGKPINPKVCNFHGLCDHVGAGIKDSFDSEKLASEIEQYANYEKTIDSLAFNSHFVAVTVYGMYKSNKGNFTTQDLNHLQVILKEQIQTGALYLAYILNDALK